MGLAHAFIISGFIGFLAGYVGSLMISKKMALAGGALGHLTIPGMTLALLMGFDVSIGAMLFLIMGILLIWFIEKRTEISMEAITAVVFSSSVAIAFLFLKQSEIVPVLMGDISKLNNATTLSVIAASAFAFLVARFIYNKIMIMNISNDLAKSMKINTDAYNLAFLFIVAISVALGVRVVGGLMTAAILSIPATSSRFISRNLKEYAYGSGLIGLIGGISGVWLSSFISIPIGSSIIICNVAIFVLLLLIKEL